MDFDYFQIWKLVKKTVKIQKSFLNQAIKRGVWIKDVKEAVRRSSDELHVGELLCAVHEQFLKRKNPT